MSSKKKKRVKSKAAKATAEARAERQGTKAPSEGGHPESVEWKGGGGLMTGMRSGFQSAVSSATDTKKQKKKGWLNTLLWIAVIAAAAAFVIGKGN